jgi:hypothetical protein
MYSLNLRYRAITALTVACLLLSLAAAAADTSNDPKLTEDQIKNFLLNAKVVQNKTSKKGITDTARLTLSDGTLTHDASFQSIDEHKSMTEMANGRMEMNFVDSYKYNIAGYVLSRMIGLDDLVPVYVERKWNGKKGSLSWWLPVKMDDVQRQAQKIEPPDQDAWNKQMYKVRVFDQLIYDTDVNLSNVLIGEDWHIWRIDFTRGFRTYKTLQHPEELVKCDRQLLEKLKALDKKQFAAATKGYLNGWEVDAVMARRDKIVDHFQKLIAEKGDAEVLY